MQNDDHYDLVLYSVSVDKPTLIIECKNEKMAIDKSGYICEWMMEHRLRYKIIKSTENLKARENTKKLFKTK